MVGDTVQGVGVLIAGILIWASGNAREWWIADPICTFIFAVLVMITTLTVMRDAMVVLMEGAPTHVNVGQLESALSALPGVVNVHELHVWSITPGRAVLVVHLAMDAQSSFDQASVVLQQAEELICNHHDIHHVTIQVERCSGNLHCQPCTYQDGQKPMGVLTHPSASAVALSLS